MARGERHPRGRLAWHGGCEPWSFVLRTIPTGALGLALIALLASGCCCSGDCPEDECRTDRDCLDDGVFCNGTPRCESPFFGGRRECVAPLPPVCSWGLWCDETSRLCVSCSERPDHPDCLEPPDAGADGRVSLVCAPDVPGRSAGSACVRFACDDSVCHEGVTASYPTTRPDGTPGRDLPIALFPNGGSCGDPCNANLLTDVCGECGECVDTFSAGNIRLAIYFLTPLEAPDFGVCRAACTPSMTGTGCDRPGYTCDLETATCTGACLSDVQCEIRYEDLDGDGFRELVDHGAGSGAYCDAVTGRCRTRGTRGARPGDPCGVDADCMDDGVCLRGEGFPEGYCTRLGCRYEGFGCGPGSTCDIRNLGTDTSGCLASCTVGAEDGTAGVRGTVSGGNPGCAPGSRCSWNGVSEPTDVENGSCLPGAYNDLPGPNLGAPCTRDAECYSPFGYGVCLFNQFHALAGGICSVHSCSTFIGESGEVVDGLLPGVEIETPICDSSAGELCVNFAGRRDAPLTYCVVPCERASECAPGYSCSEVLGGGYHLCWPTCSEDAECRAGARCESTEGDACTPGLTRCYCSDRTPRAP